jgi:hypothetical protein
MTAPARTVRPSGSRLTGSSHRFLLVNLAGCFALVAQFLLGMVANLYVTIPEHHPGARANDFFTGAASAIGWAIPNGPGWLAAHVSLGLALIIAGLANSFWASAMRYKAYTALTVLAALATIGAAFNGLSFVNYGHDFSSMIMSALWALALTCYLACLYIAATRAHQIRYESGTDRR